MFLGRSTCIYISICIHAKKNIFISNIFVVLDTENTDTYVLKNKVRRQSLKGMYLVFVKILKANFLFGTNLTILPNEI